MLTKALRYRLTSPCESGLSPQLCCLGRNAEGIISIHPAPADSEAWATPEAVSGNLDIFDLLIV